MWYCRNLETINEFVYQVKELQKGKVEDIHVLRLMFSHDPSLNVEAVMSHVVYLEIVVPIQYLQFLIESDDRPLVQLH